MNCIDFFHIVDSRDVHQLSAAERNACEAHAATCRHCAPHWIAFARLAGIPLPPMPREVAMQCAALAVIEGRAAGRRLAAGRVVVISAIATLAAAATLVWRMSDETSPEIAAEPGPVAAEPVVEVEADVPTAVTPEPEPSPPAAPADASPRFTVLVMQPRHEAPDVRKRGAVEALHASMLDELRKVPGLTLQVLGESAPEVGPSVHVLTLSSLATTLSQAGGTMVLRADGTSRCVGDGNFGMSCNPENPPQDLALALSGISTSGMYSVDGTVDEFVSFGGHSLISDEIVWIELKVEPGSPTGTPTPAGSPGWPASLPSGTARFTFPARAEGAPDPQRCPIIDGKNPYCMTPANLAAQYVNTLRLLVFPPDAAYQQRVLAQLSEGKAPEGGVTFDQLLTGLVQRNGSRLDAGTIRALVKYLASKRARTRANAWSTLRQVSHPGLIAPLLDSLRHDPDQEVRLSAMASLLQHHSTDPEVRRALEEIDGEDPDPVVRAAVRRALYGAEQ